VRLEKPCLENFRWPFSVALFHLPGQSHLSKEDIREEVAAEGTVEAEEEVVEKVSEKLKVMIDPTPDTEQNDPKYQLDA